MRAFFLSILASFSASRVSFSSPFKITLSTLSADSGAEAIVMEVVGSMISTGITGSMFLWDDGRTLWGTCGCGTKHAAKGKAAEMTTGVRKENFIVGCLLCSRLEKIQKDAFGLSCNDQCLYVIARKVDATDQPKSCAVRNHQ